MAVDRRRFLAQSSLALPVLFAGSNVRGVEKKNKASSFPGMIVRSTEPVNLEYPFDQLSGPITPNEHFYVRNHFAQPKIDVKMWKLKVEGAVRQPLELSYDDLLALPASTLTATLECAGNGRVFLVPQPQGAQWGQGAVSTARWKGVALSAILDRAGVTNAVDVVLEGADRGTVANPPSPGPIHFARSVPLKKAQAPEVILAYEMNDEVLPAAHGYPLRAIVGGWYGMAAVKWLSRIVVTATPFNGFFQSLDYSIFERREGLPTVVSITRMDVKSAIARPTRGEEVPAGRVYRVPGAAWSGEATIAKVEISADGGKSWQMATLQHKATEWSWSLWEYQWEVPAHKGPMQLMARATDSIGRTQPLTRDPDRRHYMISHIVPVDFFVK